MTSDVVETSSPNLLRLLAVIQTMILLIVVVSLIIVEIPDTTATVLVPWTTAIIQAELGARTIFVVLVTSHHRVWLPFVILIATNRVVLNMVDVEVKKNIVEEVQIFEGSQNLQKHAE